MKQKSVFSDEEYYQEELKNLRLSFEDNDRTNRNMEQKTNFLLVINVAIYTSILFFIYQVENLKPEWLVVGAFILGVLGTLDLRILISNYGPKKFYLIPKIKKGEYKDVYLERFRYSLFHNEDVTGNKGSNISQMFILLIIKIIVIFLTILFIKGIA